MYYYQNYLSMKAFRINQKFIGNMSEVLLMPLPDIIAATFKNHSTWYRIVNNPSGITIQQMLIIANGLHIPVRRFFSVGGTDIIGKRDDYITDPYIPCRYEPGAFRELMENRRDATWKKAAEVAGVTRDNLRNSLLGESRTPVTRFLAVCQAFDVNPFTILIDPNSEIKNNRQQTPIRKIGEKESMRMEILSLREDIHKLSVAVADLAGKYDALLADHKALARRVDADIEKSSRDYLSIAAERVED